MILMFFRLNVHFLGTMGLEKPVGTVAPNRGTLYRMANHSCQLDPMLKGVSISNGIAWSLDNRQMYYIDTPTRRVEVFDYSILSATLSKLSNIYYLNCKTFSKFCLSNLEIYKTRS